MTHRIDSAKQALRTATTHLATLAAELVATLASGFRPGEAHLTGAVALARASTLDEDLEVLLHDIQRRRAGR